MRLSFLDRREELSRLLALLWHRDRGLGVLYGRRRCGKSRLVLAHNPRFLALLDAARDRIKKRGGVKHEDFWKAVGKKDRRTSR